jgi:acetyltransferase-like isoleucine patch superfamily enzyme
MTDRPRHTIAPTRPNPLKRAVKAVIHGLCVVLVLPVWVQHRLGSLVIGRDRALETCTQTLAGVPGLTGVFLRRAFLGLVLTKCARDAEISYGTLLSQTGAVIEGNVYVGPRCHLGLVHLGKDVLLAAGVHIPSGGQTHFFADPGVPIREQGGERALVRIGEGAWVGSAAVVLADVGKGTIVGAGSVVTKPLPDFVIAAGVPAKVIRPRFPTTESTNPPEGLA